MKHLTDRLEGETSVVRWVATFVLLGPVYAVRFALIGVVVALWVLHAPSAVSLVWSSAMHAESVPNKKGTPTKNRTWQRLDDFDDVRARIGEQLQ